MRSILLIIITIACVSMCMHIRHAKADDIKVDTSPQAIEAAYQSVRAGDALPVVSLKDTAEGLLVKLINAATAAGDFIADQIPQVIKELLVFNTAMEVFLILVFSIPFWLGLGFWHLINKAYATDGKWEKNQSRYGGIPCWPESYSIRWIPIIVGVIISTIGITIHGVELLKLLLAPRVWLIEYAASLVK